MAAPQTITVDPSEVQAITVDPSQVSPVQSVPGMEKLGGVPPPAGQPPPTPNDLLPEDKQYQSFWTSPHGLIRSGLRQAVHGVEAMAEPGLDAKAGGASQLIRGVGKALTPAAIGATVPAMVAAPAATAGAVVGGMAGGAVGGVAGGAAARVLGAGPGVQSLASDVSGIAGGGAGAVAGSAAGRAMGQSIRTAVTGYADPIMDMVKGVRPTSTNLTFRDSLQRSMPEMKIAEQQIGKPIGSVDDALQAVKLAKQNVRAQYDQVAGNARAIGSTVDLTPVADAMEKSIPAKVALENPGVANSVMETAQKYRSQFPIEQAEELLKNANAELDAYYAKYPGAQRAAINSNADTASLAAQAKALRTAIYKTLDSDNQGAAPRELNQRYGALLQLEEQLQRRVNVAARQVPDSLSQQLSKWSAAGQAVRGGFRLLSGDVGGAADVAQAIAERKVASFVRDRQTSDALVARAFRNWKTPAAPVSYSPPPTPKGLLPRPPLVTPPPASPPDATRVNITTGAPLRAPLSRQLPSGPLVTPPPADISAVKAVNAMPVVDPETGEILYYTTESATKQTPYRFVRQPSLNLPGGGSPPQQ